MRMHLVLRALGYRFTLDMCAEAISPSRTALNLCAHNQCEFDMLNDRGAAPQCASFHPCLWVKMHTMIHFKLMNGISMYL